MGLKCRKHSITGYKLIGRSKEGDYDGVVTNAVAPAKRTLKSLNDLPTEIITIIASNLDRENMFSTRLVNTNASKITYIDKERQEEYWQKIKEQTKNESN